MLGKIDSKCDSVESSVGSGCHTFDRVLLSPWNWARMLRNPGKSQSGLSEV